MGFLKSAAVLAFTSAVLFCSCEKHKVGEFPEVQKEAVDLKKGEPGTDETKAGSTHSSSPTPAEFFPDKKNP